METNVFQGNGGGMNWNGGLTRVEAATLILRLLGAEEKAAAMQNEKSPFADVPEWANGYINYAFSQGIVNGVDETHFGSQNPCSARDFSLMLLRLTSYTEGEDYKWETALLDGKRLIEKGRAITEYGTGLDHYKDNELYSRLFNFKTFTREYACALIYRFLSA